MTNGEAISVVETEKEDTSLTEELESMELGQVTKDTQGGWWGFFDPGYTPGFG